MEQRRAVTWPWRGAMETRRAECGRRPRSAAAAVVLVVVIALAWPTFPQPFLAAARVRQTPRPPRASRRDVRRLGAMDLPLAARRARFARRAGCAWRRRHRHALGLPRAVVVPRCAARGAVAARGLVAARRSSSPRLLAARATGDPLRRSTTDVAPREREHERHCGRRSTRESRAWRRRTRQSRPRRRAPPRACCG